MKASQLEQFVGDRLPTHILGHGQAESDAEMLREAFVSTPEYRTLQSGTHSFVVVGRRGAGKSALFIKLLDHYSQVPNTIVIRITPDELDVMGLKQSCGTFGLEYHTVRATSRLAWLASLLLEALSRLKEHYRFRDARVQESVAAARDVWVALSKRSHTGRAYIVLQEALAELKASSADVNITSLSHKLDTKALKLAVIDGLRDARLKCVVMVDKLDEGWQPDELSTGFVGGLLATLNDFAANDSPISMIAFIRDNIYRAIARLDSDYTRNIEGNSIRLYWDEPSLFNFACSRARVAFHLNDVESNQKLWNRITAIAMQNREGFRRCLRFTLYRPRDLLSLLNKAFLNAARAGRNTIIEEDVEAAAKQISNDRLADLIKEYDVVFPGMGTFIDGFRDNSPELAIGSARAIVESVGTSGRLIPAAAQHFAALGANGLLRAFYGIGFVGVFDARSKQYQFCHDGRAPEDALGDVTTRLLVHPCYHIALNCTRPTTAERHDDSAEIFDEHDISVVSDQIELRCKEVGSLISAAGIIPQGDEGASDFEKWCLRALEIICAGHLTNFELHPNGNAINRRDVVASCCAANGFWKRFLDSYKAQQVVFEIKNYAEVTKQDCEQLCTYLSGRYGNAGFVVSRSEQENPSPVELGWIRELNSNEKGLCILLPLKILRRLLSKAREASKHDEVDIQLGKLLDRYERNYLALRHTKS